MPNLTRLGLPGDEQAWAALGFTVTGGRVRIGQVDCTVGAAGWGFDETHAATGELGVPYLDDGDTGSPAAHPNGVTIVDHVVYWVPELDSAVAELNAVLGIPPRRRFFPRGPEGPEMAFYRVGEPFIEVVSSGRSAALVGAAFRTPDLDATVAAVRAAGGPIGDPKPAVQGGRIASVWRGHVNWGIAFMEPKPH
ncbi:VOC family protein [Nocardia yamanashiensis]|uniref:VOC family protein n=1 Tax=Nocardia yamanashiensis TaxID=209247 RepID=UPI001E5AC8BD|nr:VOC family protein [Nocardia yamanashiensis]UGT41584.1 VOC family protein [Nocardia yamanashiensis]